MKITAYKGTDKNMKCRGYQYSLGKTHDMGEPDTWYTVKNGQFVEVDDDA